MNKRQELPIDVAYTCLAQLQAIEQLVCSIPREDGMHLVNPDHFSRLLGDITDRLETALAALVRPVA